MDKYMGTILQMEFFLLSHMLHVWYIYLQNWAVFGVNVGKSSSTMEHMGKGNSH